MAPPTATQLSDSEVAENSRSRGRLCSVWASFFSRAPSSVRPAKLQLLRAPALSARAGITFGGQSFGARTLTGLLAGTPIETTPARTNGAYVVKLPAASAALVTL